MSQSFVTQPTVSQFTEDKYDADESQRATEYNDASQEEPEGMQTPRPPPITVTGPDGDAAQNPETGITPGFKAYSFVNHSFGSAVRYATANPKTLGDTSNPFGLISFSERDEPSANLEYFLVLLGHYASPQVEWLDSFWWQDELYPLIQGAKRMTCVTTHWADDRGDGVQRDDIRFKTWYLPSDQDKHEIYEENTALKGTSGPVYIAKLRSDNEIVPINVLSWREDEPVLARYADQIEAGGGLYNTAYSTANDSQRSSHTTTNEKFLSPRQYYKLLGKEMEEGVTPEIRAANFGGEEGSEYTATDTTPAATAASSFAARKSQSSQVAEQDDDWHGGL